MEKVRLIFFIPEFVKGGAGNSIFSLVKNLDSRKSKIAEILSTYNHDDFNNTTIQ